MEWVGYIDGVPKEGEETLTLGTLPTGEDVCTTIAKEVSNTTRYIPYSRYLQYHAKSLRDCIFGFQANLCGNLHSNQTTP